MAGKVHFSNYLNEYGDYSATFGNIGGYFGLDAANVNYGLFWELLKLEMPPRSICHNTTNVVKAGNILEAIMGIKWLYRHFVERNMSCKDFVRAIRLSEFPHRLDMFEAEAPDAYDFVFDHHDICEKMTPALESALMAMRELRCSGLHPHAS